MKGKSYYEDYSILYLMSNVSTFDFSFSLTSLRNGKFHLDPFHIRADKNVELCVIFILRFTGVI